MPVWSAMEWPGCQSGAKTAKDYFASYVPRIGRSSRKNVLRSARITCGMLREQSWRKYSDSAVLIQKGVRPWLAAIKFLCISPRKSVRIGESWKLQSAAEDIGFKRTILDLNIKIKPVQPVKEKLCGCDNNANSVNSCFVWVASRCLWTRASVCKNIDMRLPRHLVNPGCVTSAAVGLFHLSMGK